MNDTEIKSNKDSAVGNETQLSDIEEAARIDALLKSTADQCNAEIEFEKIKQRALSAHKKRRKRARLLERIALAAAACLMVVGFGAIIKAIMPNASMLPDSTPGQSAMNSDKNEETDETDHSFKDPADDASGYASCVYVGTPENVNDSVRLVSEVFRSQLPSYMDKRHDDKTDKFVAKGTDKSGHYKYCDCTVISAPPYKLEPGQLGKILSQDERLPENFEFFWQIRKDVCLKICFRGFNEKEAQMLMDCIAPEHS